MVGDLKLRHAAVADVVPSLMVASPAVSVIGPLRLPRSACGRLTVMRVPVGLIGWPVLPEVG